MPLHMKEEEPFLSTVEKLSGAGACGEVKMYLSAGGHQTEQRESQAEY